jgi:hypothetical protein
MLVELHKGGCYRVPRQTEALSRHNGIPPHQNTGSLADGDIIRTWLQIFGRRAQHCCLGIISLRKS